MVGNQLAQARVGEHHWLSFQMDTEGREISTRFACSHHFFTSDMSVDRNAVPIASEELSPHRTRSKYHIEQWLSEESPMLITSMNGLSYTARHLVVKM
jgi:hypothetical protein